MYIRLSNKLNFKISLRTQRCVVCMFVSVGGERHVFKCLSVGLRKEFTGCKTTMTSCLPVTSLIAFYFFGLFFPLSRPHTVFSPAYKKPSLIDV